MNTLLFELLYKLKGDCLYLLLTDANTFVHFTPICNTVISMSIRSQFRLSGELFIAVDVLAIAECYKK